MRCSIFRWMGSVSFGASRREALGVAQMQASPIVVAGRIFVLDGRAGASRI